MTRHSLVGRILDWLRGGYPSGVPAHDYVALLGILRRTCTEAEIETIATELHDQGLASDADIRTSLARLLHETPQDEDVLRVAARLAAGGWPLAQGPDALVTAADQENTAAEQENTAPGQNGLPEGHAVNPVQEKVEHA